VSGAPTPPAHDLDAPPLLKSWRNLYILLVVEISTLVALFYALTRWAS